MSAVQRSQTAATKTKFTHYEEACPAAYCLLLSFVLCSGLDGLQDPLQKELLGQRPVDRSLLVDDGLRDGVNAVLSCQVRELGGLDAVCRDAVVLHGEAVGQAHGLRAMGSSGSDEDFEVDGLGDLTELLLAFRAQSRISLGNVDDGVEQGRELVSGGQAVKPDSVIFSVAHGGGGDLVHVVLGYLLLVEQEIVDFDRKLVGKRRQLLEQLLGLAPVLKVKLLSEVDKLHRVDHFLQPLPNFLSVVLAYQRHSFSSPGPEASPAPLVFNYIRMYAEAALFSGSVFRNAGLRPYVAAMTSRLNRMRRAS